MIKSHFGKIPCVHLMTMHDLIAHLLNILLFFLQNIMIDETDEAVFGQPSRSKKPSTESPQSSLPKKRKPGLCSLIPRPKVYIFFFFFFIIANAHNLSLVPSREKQIKKKKIQVQKNLKILKLTFFCWLKCFY